MLKYLVFNPLLISKMREYQALVGRAYAMRGAWSDIADLGKAVRENNERKP